ncbi:MAG: terminase small subunit [Acidobacteria bacterium]|nr:terminase small subunit [Acidobacteriota bacterium]
MRRTKPTQQQSRFIEAMSDPNTKNQTEAAIKAGCPPASARVTASKWLTKYNIRDAIDARRKRALEQQYVTRQEVLGSAVFQMRSSIDDVLDDYGLPSIEKARQTGAIDLIRKIETKVSLDAETGNREITYKIEMLTSQDARKEVARYLRIESHHWPERTAEQRAFDLAIEMLQHNLPIKLIIDVLMEEYPAVDREQLTEQVEAHLANAGD